jgi:hypothetical protein
LALNGGGGHDWSLGLGCKGERRVGGKWDGDNEEGEVLKEFGILGLFD